jgi:hypothetical protein
MHLCARTSRLLVVEQTACDFVLIPKTDATTGNAIPVECTVIPVAVCCKPKQAKMQHYYDEYKSKDDNEYKPKDKKKSYDDDDDADKDYKDDPDKKYKKYEDEDEEEYKPKKYTSKSKKSKKQYEPKYEESYDEQPAEQDDEEYYDSSKYDEYAEAKIKQGPAGDAATGSEGGNIASDLKKPLAAKSVTLPTPSKSAKPAAKPRSFAWILPRHAAAAAARDD